ncbi:MAG: hypothetical protein H0U49_12735 [Parachlamydiaceae bacterium]|nr:hypothetical protein [Parachlamydiaceae bacterium]
MKFVLFFLLLLNPFLLIAHKDQHIVVHHSSYIHIYLCPPLTETAMAYNNEICGELDEEFLLFQPQDPSLNTFLDSQRNLETFQEDFVEMLNADLLLVLPPYSRDCAWEIGWFCGKQRPAIAYAEMAGDWMSDAMVKGGLTAIVTNNSLLYKAFLDDPSTANKCYLINSREYLGDFLKSYICGTH